MPPETRHSNSSSINQDGPVLIFDGVCLLCQSSIKTVIRLDKKMIFRFASLQSEFGREIIARQEAVGLKSDSVLFCHYDRIYDGSDAALKIMQYLGFPWNLACALWILPKAFRNSVYDFIARNRYRWFGKSETCMIPEKSLMNRFVDHSSSQLSN